MIILYINFFPVNCHQLSAILLNDNNKQLKKKLAATREYRTLVNFMMEIFKSWYQLSSITVTSSEKKKMYANINFAYANGYINVVRVQQFIRKIGNISLRSKRSKKTENVINGNNIPRTITAATDNNPTWIEKQISHNSASAIVFGVYAVHLMHCRHADQLLQLLDEHPQMMQQF